MTTLIWGGNSAATPVRLCVSLASMLVAACFSASYVLAQEPLETAPADTGVVLASAQIDR